MNIACPGPARLFMGAALVVLATLVDNAPAAEAAQRSLAALVPDDVGLCLETQRVAHRLDDCRTGELYRRLAAFPPLAERAVEQRRAVERLVLAAFGVPLDTWRQGLLGGSTLLAVWPAAGDRLADAAGLVLVETPDEAILSTILDHWRGIFLASPEGAFNQRLVHRGLNDYTIYELRAPHRDSPAYLGVVGNLAILATGEELLHRILDLHAGFGSKAALADLPAYQRAVARVAPDCAARLFISPRPWDGLLEKALPDASAPRAQQARRLVLSTWKAIDYVVAAAEISTHLRLEAYIDASRQRLPEPLDSIVGAAAGGSRLLDHVPTDVLAGWAGRLDMARIIRAVTAYEAEQGRPIKYDLERLIVVTLLTGMGPDAVAYVAPVSSDDMKVSGASSRPLPLDLVFGAGTHPLQPGEPPLAESLDAMFRTAMNMAVRAYNAHLPEPLARMEFHELDGERLTSLAGIRQLEGATVSYVRRGEQIWAASSATALERLLRLAPAEALPSDRLAELLHNPRVGKPGHALWLNLAAIRQWMAEHPSLVEWIAARKGLDEATAEKSWRELRNLVGLADGVLLEGRVDQAGLSASVTIVAEPAR